MALFRPQTLVAACAALLCSGVLAACGEHHPGVDEPAREGLALDVGGLEYNVFITRELNLRIPPDQDLYDGPAARPGRALFGVFIQVCNVDGEPVRSVRPSAFTVEDNQGNEFEPIELEEDNAFAYAPRTLAKGDCIPEVGSVAQQGPTAGSMLLFEFPLENTENRPLELKIHGPQNLLEGTREVKTVELDL
jgi:hypothetical protein